MLVAGRKKGLLKLIQFVRGAYFELAWGGSLQRWSESGGECAENVLSFSQT